MTSLSSLLRRAVYEWFYLCGQPRWDTGITPPEVRQLIEEQHLPRGRALDVGCGTGTNVVYLAKHGFEVTGIDFIPRAIRKARERARNANVGVELRVANVLEPLDLGAPFDLVLDIGCFHNFDSTGRARYVENLVRWTHPGTIYLLYAFFPSTMGPRRFGVTPQSVRDAFSPGFKILHSTADEKNADQDSAWYRLERL